MKELAAHDERGKGVRSEERAVQVGRATVRE
jgi:hypothetical protein